MHRWLQVDQPFLTVELPAGQSIKAVENTDKVFHLVIPAKPTELSDEDLDAVAGGATNPAYVAYRVLSLMNDGICWY